MEEQLKKLKARSVITLILSLLALTWQFLNYITVKDLIPSDILGGEFSILMVYLSYIFFIFFLIAAFFLIFTAYRVNMKYNSLKKKELIINPEKLNTKENKVKDQNN